MEYVDFMHLVRVSEQACEEDAKAYRRSVWWFTVLGYAAVIVLAALAVAALVGVWLAFEARGLRGWMVMLGLTALALLFASAQALFMRFDEPEGYRLTAQDAPELFKALERIRRAVRGPAIDVVMIDGDFNASIMQRPRHGLFGHTNYLVIGWPMLCALEPKRLLAVIAHEYGHLRGDHGKFSAWVYRTRVAWGRMHERYSAEESAVSWLLRGFFGWYIPRFSARTFALARQDEYEADRIAARLCSPEVVGQAWCEIDVKSSWYGDDFWRRMWQRARSQERPEPMPHAAMAQALMQEPPPAQAQEALRVSMARLPSYDDTHPVPKDRLAALGVKPAVPAWSCKPALELLGACADKMAAHFDDEWWSANRRDWAQHRERLLALQQRAAELKQRAAELSADEWVEWAECMEMLTMQDTGAYYERALQKAPSHARALRRLADSRLQASDPETMPLLDRLQDQHPAHGYAASSMALELIDRLQHAGHDMPAATRRQWRERRERFEAQEQKAWEEFMSAGPCERTGAPQWSEQERKRVVDVLIRTPEVVAAWMGGKQLAAMPGRDYLVLFVQLTSTDEGLGRQMVQQLVHALQFLSGRLQVTVVGLYVRESEVQRTYAVNIYKRRGQRAAT